MVSGVEQPVLFKPYRAEARYGSRVRPPLTDNTCVTTYIALLRAINLGSHGKVSMNALRDLLAELGLGNARTLLNSGNAVFSSDGGSAGDLAARLEKEASAKLDLRTDFLLRTAAEWDEIIGANPFAEEAQRDPSHLLTVFLKEAPATAAVDALRKAITGPEAVQAHGRQLYVTYPAGIGTSKLRMPLIERTLGTRGTGRNWNTLLKLQALASG